MRADDGSRKLRLVDRFQVAAEATGEIAESMIGVTPKVVDLGWVLCEEDEPSNLVLSLSAAFLTVRRLGLVADGGELRGLVGENWFC